MTKETLQVELDKKNIKAKILHVEKTDYKDYEVIFTRDLNYAVLEIKRILSKRAWYEEA